MTNNLLNQWTISKTLSDDYIEEWAEAFLVDKKVQNLSPGTIHFYKSKLTLFFKYCDSIALYRIQQLTPTILRDYLLYLESKGHNPGGIHAAYRTIRTFLNWWEEEVEPEGFKNPIRKVKAPKVDIKPIEPVSITKSENLLSICTANGCYDLRDKALFLFLLDTGARASEVCGVNSDDIDLMFGEVLIRNGKGGKPRTVFLGKKTRKAIRSYLKFRTHNADKSNSSALWITSTNTRLTYWGLNQILRRRSEEANIEKPTLHDFRRAFALNFLRNGGDIFSLQKLMGHADLQVLRRYLAQTTEDLRTAHSNFSPVDNAEL